MDNPYKGFPKKIPPYTRSDYSSLELSKGCTYFIQSIMYRLIFLLLVSDHSLEDGRKPQTTLCTRLSASF
jgi:hypothetical protein